MKLLERMKDLNISHVLAGAVPNPAFPDSPRSVLYLFNKLAERGKVKRIFKTYHRILYEVHYDGQREYTPKQLEPQP